MTDTLDLAFVQGETFVIEGLSYADDGVPQSFLGFTPMAQVRKTETITSALAIDLTPFFTVSEDGASLSLRVPATVMAALDPALFTGARDKLGAYWDLFLVDENDPTNADRFLQGRATLDPATTRTVTA